ncbi:MAG TPA: metallophosphoesterase [Rhizomicrobium sp.]|nr:metallophosphoesterase [Rhizomicrobium sp.]
MKRIVLLALAAFFAATNIAGAVSWVQLGPGGAAEVRATSTGAACPKAILDGATVPMAVRAAADANFPLLCALAVPQGARSLMIDGTTVVLPVADPQRILVLGDTGCRIKGTALQACNDPKSWPFPGLANAAAAQKPDLVLHLGDYLYRESPCPATFAGCTGSPWGDNWVSWDADFFTPAASLLAAAPWIIVRGNHEDCFRAGPGFLRLLGPQPYDPAAPCIGHLSPYAVPVGSQIVAIMDSSSAPDTSVDPAQLPLYQQDFEALKAMANLGSGHELWLASHRPIWGAISFMGAPAGGNATMIKAAGDLSVFNAISLMLSGHIHTFEAITYVDKIPPQIVAGHGGDNLDVTPADLRGTIFQGDSGVHVKTGFSVGGFGFLMLTRVPGNAGWTIEPFDSDGHQIKQCAYQERSIFCLSPR